MSRLLIIPAAGSGSRLRSPLPKCLVPVGGRTMLARLLDLWRPAVQQVVVVASPTAEALVRSHLDEVAAIPADVVVQERPTGMLDAVMLASEAVQRSSASRLVVTWCDQVAIDPQTVARVIAAGDAEPDAGLVMPVVTRPEPYIHFDRDTSGRIVGVRHRREGDVMPDVGEGDAGVFSFSRQAFLELLPRYAESLTTGAATGERNLLPFIPWLANLEPILTVPCSHVMESVGINTPEELAAVETYLRGVHR